LYTELFEGASESGFFRAAALGRLHSGAASPAYRTVLFCCVKISLYAMAATSAGMAAMVRRRLIYPWKSFAKFVIKKSLTSGRKQDILPLKDVVFFMDA
jgi:hypothetical protein